MMNPQQEELLTSQYNADGYMTAEWQAQFMYATFSPWAQERGGFAKVLANPRHLWEEIFNMQDRPGILICWNGETSRGEFKQANTLHRVDRQWAIAIIRGHGFKNLMAEGIGQPNTPGVIDPFYKDCQIIRDIFRGLNCITEEAPLDYKGMEPIPSMVPYGNSGNVFMDGFFLRGSTANDLLMVSPP